MGVFPSSCKSITGSTHKLRHDFCCRIEAVLSSLVQCHPGFEIAKGRAADIRGHAGFISQGKRVGRKLAFKRASRDLNVGAEGLLRIARIDNTAHGDLIAIADARQLQHQVIGVLHIL